MERVILVRHGQTEWNRVERFRGRADLPLDPTGIAQAEATGKVLRHWPVSRIFSSPLRRAWQTAGAIAHQSHLSVEPLEGLIDIDYGEWQGMTPDEVQVAYPEDYRTWLETPSLAGAPGGESLSSVRERAAAALSEVVAANPDRTILLVSHKVVCKLLVLHAIGQNTSHFWTVEQDNCGFNVFERRRGRYYVTLLNETCHLPTPPQEPPD